MGVRLSRLTRHLRVAVKKDAVTGVRLVAVGRKKKGASGLAGTKLK